MRVSVVVVFILHFVVVGENTCLKANAYNIGGQALKITISAIYYQLFPFEIHIHGCKVCK